MGLATIDPHSQKENAETPKTPKPGANQASLDRDTGIQKHEKITNKCMEMQTNLDKSPDLSAFPYIPL